MPTIFEAKAGENSIQYFHYSMVRFYLDQSFEYAIKAKEGHIENTLQANTIIAIVFAAMALEAFVNEIADGLIDKEELDHFIRLRKGYHKPAGVSSLVYKINIVIEKTNGSSLSPELNKRVENLVDLRNNMSHYKMSELTGKRILPPMRKTTLPNGEAFTTIDFMVEPIQVLPPFIAKVTAKAAVESFNTALAVLGYWGKARGVENVVPGLQEIA